MVPHASTTSDSTENSKNQTALHAESDRESESRANGWHACPRELKPGARCTIEPRHSWYLPVKRCADLLLAVVLLILLSPFIAVGALLVKWTSRGPALYRQVRVGKNGCQFT